ncbi:hypothetical protein LSH36_21g06019 [Paralvinella palmiformis]|uniref:Uncharacterized protein n=1 Tax=Paralvinella palmiformis TaxID=53620 RepID=A0AAD9KB27_9ANNE|nr:hypothetical protein LSH36_21g06019 [Paralvinella palmiformis]
MDPSSLNFEIDHTWVADRFLRADIFMSEGRHILFATDTILNLL